MKNFYKAMISLCVICANLFVPIFAQESVDPNTIEAYSNTASITISNNTPDFTDKQKSSTETFLHFSKLDSLKRPGQAYGCIGKEIMPKANEKRGTIGMIKPAGWHTIRYDDLIKDKYLYNRCHLIAWSLSSENANEKNLVTGTRYMNVDGMLPHETDILEYIRATNNHVFYRVTPIYVGDELLCRGVQMEAYSIEDHGQGICFNVYCYNVQPGITIDYATGDSQRSQETTSQTEEATQTEYIINTNTHVFHSPSCQSVSTMKESNKQYYTGSHEELEAQGYRPCQNCNP